MVKMGGDERRGGGRPHHLLGKEGRHFFAGKNAGEHQEEGKRREEGGVRKCSFFLGDAVLMSSVRAPQSTTIIISHFY